MTRIVPTADIRPHHCVVFPQLGSSHRDGYFDTGNEIVAIDPHAYVSVHAVKVLAAELGWIGPDQIAEKDDRIAQLEAEVAQETARADKAEAIIQAVDVIESADFRARKKAGRKPVEKAAA